MAENIGSASEHHVTIILPLPPKQLSPNARPHWAAKAKAAKQYRERAGMTAMVLLRNARLEKPLWKLATANVRFFWQTAAKHDADNAMASLKNGLDGLADAGVIVNDHGLFPRLKSMSVDKANPRVEITVIEISEIIL